MSKNTTDPRTTEHTEHVDVKVKETVRVIAVPPVNHLYHGTLTVLTAGLWAPIWILAVINRNAKR